MADIANHTMFDNDGSKEHKATKGRILPFSNGLSPTARATCNDYRYALYVENSLQVIWPHFSWPTLYLSGVKDDCSCAIDR